LPGTVKSGGKRMKSQSQQLPGRTEVRSHPGGDVQRLLYIQRI
jgi:hypothetical protein